MTSTDYARQIADRLLFLALFPQAGCCVEGAAFDLETTRLIVRYGAELEREHPGVTGHMARWQPVVSRALVATVGEVGG